MTKEPPQLSWEWGTAYDLFASLYVLHKPDEFGLRPSWAAGVRSRLPADARETLEKAQSVIGIPFYWLHNLPDPKDGATVIWALGQLSPAERLSAVVFSPYWSKYIGDIYQRVSARGSWDEDDLESLKENIPHKKEKSAKSQKYLAAMLDVWADAEAFGEGYLEALSVYQDVFFAEEERRIKPALKDAHKRAQDLSAEMSFTDMLEQLSQGVRFSTEWEVEEWIMVPSYWLTPYLFYDRFNEDQAILLYGARPPDVSLVPGELVPENILRVLKTLADPTRLKILRYLTHENLTQAELARRLRLRAPTVTHHLKDLRLAGLVYLNVGEKGERRYECRFEAVKTMCDGLQGFLKQEVDE
jgi:DNA-binding transcriptional ArsR family regulator